jgi:hypothetical protein
MVDIRMTLLSVIKDVCLVVGVQQPTSVFASIGGNRTMQEMAGLATEMAQRAAYEGGKDWTILKKLATLTGDGVKTAFDLPADYSRMLLTSDLWRSTSTQVPMTYIVDTNEWVRRRSQPWVNAWGEWTMLGGQIVIEPAMAAGVSATFGYLNKNCIALASGGYGDTFMADTDSFVLGDRVLKLGMIWQWKANKGSPYAEDLATYNDALNVAMGSEKSAPIILGRKPISATTAYPWPVP